MIAISPGHTLTHPGASYEDFTEHREACEWIRILQKVLFPYTALFVVPAESLENKVRFINERRAVLALEIHFNSNKEMQGMGSKTLYHPKSENGKRFAQIVQGAIGLAFKPNNGIREGWYRGEEGKPLYFLQRTKCPAVIVEAEYVWNHDKIEAYRNLACLYLAGALLQAQKEVY